MCVKLEKWCINIYGCKYLYTILQGFADILIGANDGKE